MKNDLVNRWQKITLEKAMQTRRVLLLSGARQTGKTTLAKEVAMNGANYLTLDNLATREIAENDPQGFIQKDADKILVIDEVQRVPSLLSAIKLAVDEDTTPGQYLSTGSANIQSLPHVQESLAGRIRKIRLRTLTEGEILNARPDFISNAFNLSKGNKYQSKEYDRKKVISIAFRGGFPEAMYLDAKERRQWHLDYVSALLERDLLEIARITRHGAMQELVHILAAWSSKLMDISSLSTGLSIRRNTIESYLNALEALYLVERVKPWTRTDYERVGKKDKLYMTDSGLMSSILSWQQSQVEWDADRAGKLIETFVFNELATQVDTSVSQYELFHYRDREQHEIDFLIERDDQALLGIEVKAGSSISTKDFRHLKWFKDNIAKNRKFVGVVLYTGEMSGAMGDSLWALPFKSLWPENAKQ